MLPAVVPVVVILILLCLRFLGIENEILRKILKQIFKASEKNDGTVIDSSNQPEPRKEVAKKTNISFKDDLNCVFPPFPSHYFENLKVEQFLADVNPPNSQSLVGKLSQDSAILKPPISSEKASETVIHIPNQLEPLKENYENSFVGFGNGPQNVYPFPLLLHIKKQLEVNQFRAETVSLEDIAILGPRISSNQRLEEGLIIAADACTKGGGGYIINSLEGWVEYYSEPWSEMPWTINNMRDSSELEMKNLLTALLQFEEKIANRMVKIYTDNSAILGHGKFSSKVYGFVDHLTYCRGVTVLNNFNFYVNRGVDPDKFNKLIKPADDLSRGNVPAFLEGMGQKYSMDLIVKVDLDMARSSSAHLRLSKCACGYHLREREDWKFNPGYFQ